MFVGTNLTDDRIYGNNAQYLLINGPTGIDSNVTMFSTIQYPEDLSLILSGNSAIYTRLQNIIQAFISKGDGTIEDLVFLNHHWALRNNSNPIRLQAYVKSTKQFWTLIAGETPTLVEMDAIKTNNSTNLDRKNDTGTLGLHSRGYNYLMMPGRITKPLLMFDTLGSSRNSTSFIVTESPGKVTVTLTIIDKTQYGNPQLIVQNISLTTVDGTPIPYTVSLTGDWGDETPLEAIFYKLSNNVVPYFLVDHESNRSTTAGLENTYYKIGNEIVLTIEDTYLLNQVVCSYHRGRYTPTLDITYKSETVRVLRFEQGGTAVTQTATFT